MIRVAATALAIVAAPTLGSAQVKCLPPAAPFAYAPPADDPELRDLIDEEYQDYIRDTGTYLNCLNAETARVRGEFDTVMTRYVRFFGIEADIGSDATD